MRQYDVKFVIVGQLELITYPEQGLEKFSQLAEAGMLDRVFQNEGVEIYRLN